MKVMRMRAVELREQGLTLAEISAQLAKEFDGKVRSRERIRQIVAKGLRLRDRPDPEGFDELPTHVVNTLRLADLNTRAEVYDWVIHGMRYPLPGCGRKGIAAIYQWLGFKPPAVKTLPQMNKSECIDYLIARYEEGTYPLRQAMAKAYGQGYRKGKMNL